MTDSETQVRELLADLEMSYRSKDADRIVSHDAPEIVMFDLAPPLRHRPGDTTDIGGGREVDMTTAEGVRTWLAGFGDAEFEYETKDLQVVSGDEVAFAYCLARIGSPGRFSLWHRLTIGLHKREGKWQIVHTHASVPFYMDDSGRAALDLVP
jgi:ketosteroid isomerase-like protein